MQGVMVSLEELIGLQHLANKLNLPQQRVTNNSQQGSFRSSFRGRGMDFVETRVYQPGDDVRAINWSVTARTGKPHTKIYQQERDRPIYLVVDFSPTMFFGTRNAFKSVIAGQVATLLAWMGVKNGDRVGALLVKNSIKLLPPTHHKHSLIELLKNLVQFVEPNREVRIDYSVAFRQLKKVLKSGTLIYFISDYYFLNESLKNELLYLAKSHEVTNILIYDLLEKEAPKGGRYLFHDASKAESLLVDTHSKKFCDDYSKVFADREMELKKLCFAAGMRMGEISTSDEIVCALKQVLF